MDIYSKENIELIVNKNNNIKDCLIELGRGTTGDNYNFLKRKIKKFNIDISHFLPKTELQKIAREKRGGTFRDEISIENTFKKSDRFVGSSGLRKKILKYNLKEYKCELCGQDENWKGNKIILILDHINGINTDNRLENLRFVCPNCDTTLQTFKGKNSKSNKEKLKRKQEEAIGKNKKLKDLEKIILENNIDFSKKTWGVEVAKILNKSPQYSLKFIKNKLPHLLRESINRLY